MENGLSFSSSTDGETVSETPGVGDKQLQFPTPGLLIEEAIKLSFAHAPVKGDIRIWRGHSSWRSRRRGNTCSSPHCMAPTKNLHRLIRAQLAKTRGNRPQVRIAPCALPGYIAVLRETNLAGGGEGRPKPYQLWTPKAANPGHGRHAGELRHSF